MNVVPLASPDATAFEVSMQSATNVFLDHSVRYSILVNVLSFWLTRGKWEYAFGHTCGSIPDFSFGTAWSSIHLSVVFFPKSGSLASVTRHPTNILMLVVL